MRILPDDVYISSGQWCSLSPFQLPAVLIKGETYTLSIPMSWSAPTGIMVLLLKWRWKEMHHFTFGAKLAGQSKKLLHIFTASKVGQVNNREGYYIFQVRLGPRTDDILGIDLPIGSHMLYIHGEAYASYVADSVIRYGEGVTPEVGFRIEVVSGAPICSFITSTTTGPAPLYVEFTDTSQAPPQGPITSWLWNFGDGETSYQRDPSHVFQAPGTYTVTLTVTNKYGSSSSSLKITVLEAAPRPVFHPQSYCTTAIDVDKAFTPVLIIENQGGPGNIFVNYVIEGKTRPIIGSVYIAGYTTYNVPMASHTIDWYLGYKPDKSRYVDIMFQTGPVGKAATGQFPVRIVVYVEEVPPGEFPCPYCDMTFSTKAELDEHIRTVHPEEAETFLSKYWPFLVGGGALILGIGGYVVLRKK